MVSRGPCSSLLCGSFKQTLSSPRAGVEVTGADRADGRTWLGRRMFRPLAWQKGGALRSFKQGLGQVRLALRVDTGTGIDRKEIICFQNRWTS